MSNYKYTERPIGSLIPYVNNSRTHSDAQVNKIAASIKEFGFTNPVLIDEENGVIAGHGRIMAAQKLKMENLPCIILSGLTEAQKKAYVIADNKIALDAGWDEEMLAVEFDFLEEMDFDLTLTDFDDDEIFEIMGGDEEPEDDGSQDVVPEPQEKVISKKGDVWIMGKHRLMCGDGTDVNSIANLINQKKPDVVFTDPPYGIGLDKEGQKLGKSQSYGAVLNDHSSDVAKKAFEIVTTLKVPEIYFWGANHYSSCLPDASCWIVWDKQGGKSVTYADCELCYTNIDKPVRMFTHIWDGFRRDSEKGEKRVHPTQKPVSLFIDIWEKFNAGNVILDLFGGSGSTLIACESTGRACLMMELDPKYVDVIIKRWQEFTGSEAIHEETGVSFEDMQNELL